MSLSQPELEIVSQKEMKAKKQRDKKIKNGLFDWNFKMHHGTCTSLLKPHSISEK